MLRLSTRHFAAKTATTKATTAAAAASAAGGRTGGLSGSSASTDITAFCALPADAVSRLPIVDQQWLQIDGPLRQVAEKVIATKPNFTATKSLATRKAGIQAANDHDAALPTSAAIEPKLPAAVKAFIAAGKSDIETLFDKYNDLSLLLRGLEREREIIQLEIWGYNDAIQLGLKFFSQDKLTQKKKALAEAIKALAANRALIKKTAEQAFTTEVMNELLNVLRILATTRGDRDARTLGVQILDDLSLFGVPFSGETQLLFRNLVFGDMPHEDSGLLFELVEGSVGGNVSVKPVTPDPTDAKARLPELDGIADETLTVISQRFQTPLSDDLAKLRMVDTHPMLQRSTE